MSKYRLWNKVDRVMIYPDGGSELYITLDGRIVRVHTYDCWGVDRTDIDDVSDRYIIMRDSGIVDGIGVPVYEGDIIQCKYSYKVLTYEEWDKGKRMDKVNPKVDVVKYTVHARSGDGCLLLDYDLELSKLVSCDADGARRLLEYEQHGRSTFGESETRMYRFRVVGNVYETSGKGE